MKGKPCGSMGNIAMATKGVEPKKFLESKGTLTA